MFIPVPKPIGQVHLIAGLARDKFFQRHLKATIFGKHCENAKNLKCRKLVTIKFCKSEFITTRKFIKQGIA